jgi:hypothetical protein
MCCRQAVALCGHVHLAGLALPGAENQHGLGAKQLAAVGLKWFKKQQLGAGVVALAILATEGHDAA